MHRRDIDRILRRALRRAGVVTGYEHRCRRKGCGFKKLEPTSDAGRCPKCSIPAGTSTCPTCAAASASSRSRSAWTSSNCVTAEAAAACVRAERLLTMPVVTRCQADAFAPPLPTPRAVPPGGGRRRDPPPRPRRRVRSGSGGPGAPARRSARRRPIAAAPSPRPRRSCSRTCCCAGWRSPARSRRTRSRRCCSPSTSPRSGSRPVRGRVASLHSTSRHRRALRLRCLDHPGADRAQVLREQGLSHRAPSSQSAQTPAPGARPRCEASRSRAPRPRHPAASPCSCRS